MTEALARKLLGAAIQDVRSRGLDLLVVVFVPDRRGVSSVVEDYDWRLATIRSVLDEKRVRFVDGRDVLRRDMARTGKKVEEYFLHDDRHYNAIANTVMAGVMKDSLPGCSGNRRSGP